MTHEPYKKEKILCSLQQYVYKGVKTLSLFEKMKFLVVCMFLGAFLPYFNPGCEGRLEVSEAVHVITIIGKMDGCPLKSYMFSSFPQSLKKKTQFCTIYFILK